MSTISDEALMSAVSNLWPARWPTHVQLATRMEITHASFVIAWRDVEGMAQTQVPNGARMYFNGSFNAGAAMLRCVDKYARPGFGNFDRAWALSILRANEALILELASTKEPA